LRLPVCRPVVVFAPPEQLFMFGVRLSKGHLGLSRVSGLGRVWGTLGCVSPDGSSNEMR
jgi:hypothetical protein